MNTSKFAGFFLIIASVAHGYVQVLFFLNLVAGDQDCSQKEIVQMKKVFFY